MPDLDDIIESLKEDGRDDDAAELEKLRGSNLRKAAGKTAELETKNAELQAKLTKIEEAPKREKALKDYGVDVDNLSKAERVVLANLDGELNDEKVAELVREYDLPVVESGSSDEGTDVTAAERVARQAAKAPAGAKVGTTLKPTDTVDWSHERLTRFSDAHPDEYEALMRGETVTGVTG